MLADINKGIFDFKCFVHEPIQKLLELLQDQEVQAFLNHLDGTEQLSCLVEMVR
jgi:hypothetical protein